MSDITIEISQDPSTVINVGPVEETLINSLTLNEGLINHSVTHISGGSDELFHNSLRVQGGQSGQYYHLTQNEYSNNLYKYDLPVYQTGNQEISGNKSFSNRPYVNGTGVLLSGEFANTGYLVGYVPRIETGQFYAASNPSGFITGVDFSPYATIGYVTGASGSLQIQIDNLNGSTGSYVLDSETGIFITQSQTGLFYASNNPSGFITGIDLSSYATIGYVSGASGILQTQIDTLSGATGSYVLDSETGNFITQNQTGAFYAANNPSGFITGVDLSNYSTISYSTGISGYLQNQISDLNNATGDYVLQSQTGQFYAASNPSGFITGIENLVYTTGDQNISGVKTFKTGIFVEGNIYTNNQLQFSPKSAQNITQTIYSDSSDQLVLGITSAGKRVYIGSSSLTYALGSNFYVSKLAIGTSTVPTEALTVVGNISASGSVTANNLVYKGGNTDGAALTIGTNDAQELNLETNNVTRLNFNSSGTIGFKTSNGATGASWIPSANNNAGLFSSSYFWAVDIGTASGNTMVYGPGAGNPNSSYFRTNGLTRMVMTSGGDIGIGTSTPLNKLHVVGKDAASGSDFIALFQEPGITPEASSIINTAADRSIMVQGAGGAFYLGRDVTNDIEFAMGTSILGEAFAGAVSNHNFSLRTNNIKRLTCSTNGNVGIDTETPNEKLTVSGNISATGSIAASSATIGGNINAQKGIFQYGAPDGCLNLGADVNTTTRTAGVRKLASIVAPEFSNTKNIEFFNMDSNSSISANVSIGGRSGGSQYAATSLSFVTAPNTSTQGGTVNMFIQGSSGRVGIGTITPQAGLHVSGSDNSGRIRIQSTNSDPVLEMQSPSGTSYLFTNAGDWMIRTDSTSRHVKLQAGSNTGQGKVQIGSGNITTNAGPTPTSQLVVRDNTNSTSSNILDLQDFAGDSKLQVRSDGQVTIVGSITANNLVYTSGDQTIAGVKTFSDNLVGNGTSNRLPNQEMIPSTPNDSIITKANYLAMNLFEAGRIFEVQASASLIRTDTGSGTSISSANFVHGIGSINIGNYTTSTIRMILAAANWMYSTGTGATLNYALPWAISFKFFHFLRDLNTVHRIYIGTNSNNTSFPLPLKGADAYPTGGFRGIGIEFKKDPDNLYGTQCRLFARDGYNQGGVVDGTFVASDWTVLWPNSNIIGPAHHLILTNDGVGNIALFANNWNGNASLPSMTSRIPLITLSGTGVPIDQKSVTANWGGIEMCMVNDGVNPAVSSSNQMNMYPMKIQIGNLL